ncbi:MAG: SRPBCC domain-containing protein [Actinomycetota bacterium]|nr:SRPBCC domain-containing protein [Actinomycetota bacterium]
MNPTTVTTPNELEIRVERIFDAPRAHVFSVWTDPQLIPEWWGDGTVVEEMPVRPGGTYRFRTAFGVVEGEYQRGRGARAARADVPEPPVDARVRGSR